MNKFDKHCLDTLKDMLAYVHGVMYKCPICGEAFERCECEELPNGQLETPCCRGLIVPEELEQIALDDYLDVLCYDYVVGENLEYRGVILTLECGGPTVTLSTVEYRIDKTHGSEHGGVDIPEILIRAIDDIYAEKYEKELYLKINNRLRKELRI